ncbi:hypothetical protein DW091_02330 [Eubacterium sp. AM05-23]|uniref:hypothetical protein n=1 Tax=Eubacterium TaxID=1730 RepID=UPI000E541853|nr:MULTISPECIES: hypothetical protein [Eubacterium]RHO60325.1 hypothetical protein DW091_02330 [Eubacterium sp. AM05-23]
MFLTRLTLALENSASSLTNDLTPTVVPSPTASPTPTAAAETVTETVKALNTIIDRLDQVTIMMYLAVGVTAAIIVCLILYKCISAFVDY